jgi:hypothetical protein
MGSVAPDVPQSWEIEIPQAMFGLLADGTAEIRFEMYSLTAGGSHEAFAIDFLGADHRAGYLSLRACDEGSEPSRQTRSDCSAHFAD